jgi:hypothetical protein
MRHLRQEHSTHLVLSCELLNILPMVSSAHDERDHGDYSAKGQTKPGEQRVNEECHENMRS